MQKHHQYSLDLNWIGNLGSGTSSYKEYGRDYLIEISGKNTIKGSSDPAFRGSATKHNPEELFLGSVASCHMLWYLHLCSENGVNVTSYKDHPIGVMEENTDGSGRFTEITLYPEVMILDISMKDLALSLHSQANKYCFIANSCNFPILHQPNIMIST